MTSEELLAAMIAARDAIKVISDDHRESMDTHHQWPANQDIWTEEINKVYGECEQLAMDAFDLW